MKKKLALWLALCLCAGIGGSACGTPSQGNSESSLIESASSSTSEETLDENQRTIITAYEEYYEVDTENGDYAYILQYYGKFDSGAIVALMSSSDEMYLEVVWEETIAGYDFSYGNSNRIQVLYGMHFYTLSQAYALGYLTEDDVFEVVKIRCEDTPNPEEALQWALKRRTVLNAIETTYPDAGKASIRVFYGLFNSGAIVAMLDAENYDFMDVEWTETVGDKEFKYSDSNQILVLYENAFYSLTEAYDKKYISEYDLGDIYFTHYNHHYLIYENYSEFSFALTWNTYGVSSYDSQTGVLIKRNDVENVEECTAIYPLTEEQKRKVFEYFRTVNFDAFPDEYEPCENMSVPCITLVLTIRYGDKVKTITANCVNYDYIGKNPSAQTFLDTCKMLQEMLEGTDAWKDLPDYPYYYD